jgi:hypothetical protein
MSMEIDIPILRDEEDEPDFAPIIERAKARIARVDFDDPHVTFELETIRDLLAVIDHLECEIDAREHHISEGRLHYEAEDEPGYQPPGLGWTASDGTRPALQCGRCGRHTPMLSNGLGFDCCATGENPPF